MRYRVKWGNYWVCEIPNSLRSITGTEFLGRLGISGDYILSPSWELSLDYAKARVWPHISVTTIYWLEYCFGLEGFTIVEE